MALPTVDFVPIPTHKKRLGMHILKRVGEYALYVTAVDSFELHQIRVKEKVTTPLNGNLVLAKKAELIASSADFGQYGWCYDRLSTMIRREGIMFGEHLDEILAKLYELGFHEDNDYFSGKKFTL